MSKKGISFGKISFNFNKAPEFEKSSVEQNEPSTSGFGTFSRTPIEEHRDIEEISEDLESQHVQEVMGIRNFGKKAKNFNIDELMAQARKTARDKQKKKPEASSSDASKEKETEYTGPQIPLIKPSTSSSNINSEENDEELIGPPLPPGLAEDDDELIGPPIPKELDKASKTKMTTSKTKDEDSEGDSYDDLSESDEEELSLEKRIPCSHEIALRHGQKAVVALAADPSGARLASGSVDYTVSFWDFAGMDSSLRSFRSLQPCEQHPLVGLQYSSTGDCLLVLSGAAQAKVLDRDGFELLQCSKGDQYITDMAKTKGHTASLTSGCWHPAVRDEFATAARDNTVRLWRVGEPRQQKQVVRPRRANGLPVAPTAVAFSRDGHVLAAGCADGSLQMWDHRKNYVHTCCLVRSAHEPDSVVCSVAYSWGGTQLATRGADGSLRLWDARRPTAPLRVWTDLPARYDQTDCTFSPDDRLLLTAESLRPGEKNGRLLFYSTDTFDQIAHIDVGPGHAVRALWHSKLNQLLVGCGSGQVKVYYDPRRSLRGALLARTARTKRKELEVVSAVQVLTPHALPLFRAERARTQRKRLERERMDPRASRRPDLPLLAGRGGRVAASGSTLSSFVIRNLGLSKRVDDAQDPRAAILAHAAAAAADPYWVAPAYARTQPTPVFQDTDEPKTKQKKV